MSLPYGEFETTLPPMPSKTSVGPRRLPILTIVAHPNPNRVGDISLLLGLDRGQTKMLSRIEPEFKAPGRFIGQPLADPFISREPLLLKSSGEGELEWLRGRSKTQVFIGGQRLDERHRLSYRDLVKGVVLVLAERVVLMLHWTNQGGRLPKNNHGLVGFSDSLLSLHEEIGRVADLDTPVLLRGETGTGKELVARAIHQRGLGNKPFISVNMGAIPVSLAASELFGAVKGSFTGSERHQQGFFRAAQGGTLFLDEIGEATPEIQVMLLRALETGEVSPVGSQTSYRFGARLIAATDADLESKIERGSFKAPLFHRLAGYEISLPPLHERLEDLGRLFFHFAREELKGCGEVQKLVQNDPSNPPWLASDVAVALLNYAWPGNIRELRNAVRQLVIGCRGQATLFLGPKVSYMLENSSKPEAPDPPKQNRTEPAESRRKPAQIQAAEVIETLSNFGWSIKDAADELGISRGALYLLIKKIPDLRQAAELGADEIHASLEAHQGDFKAAAQSLKVSPYALRRRMRALDDPPKDAN